MTNFNSEIIDFYPTDFFVDLKGKRYAWLGEVNFYIFYFFLQI